MGNFTFRLTNHVARALACICALQQANYRTLRNFPTSGKFLYTLRVVVKLYLRAVFLSNEILFWKMKAFCVVCAVGVCVCLCLLLFYFLHTYICCCARIFSVMWVKHVFSVGSVAVLLRVLVSFLLLLLQQSKYFSCYCF